MKQIRPQLALAIPALVLGGGVLYFYVARNTSLENQAARLMACFRNNDAPCILSYCDQDDISTYGLTPKSIVFLTERLGVIAKFTSDPIEVQKQPGGTIVTGTAFCRTNEGKRVSLGFVVSDTSEGVKAPQLVTAFLLTLSTLKVRESTTVSGAKEKLTAWRDFAISEGALFTKNGFPGVLRSPEEGLLKWDAWARSCQARLDRLEKTNDR
jgi:hypothetical protein